MSRACDPCGRVSAPDRLSDCGGALGLLVEIVYERPARAIGWRQVDTPAKEVEVLLSWKLDGKAICDSQFDESRTDALA